MIVILDNAEPYENHRIWFIDIGNLPERAAVELLVKRACLNSTDYGDEDTRCPFVVAVVELAKGHPWHAPKSLTPVSALWSQIDKHSCKVARCRDAEVDEIRHDVREILESLRAAMSDAERRAFPSGITQPFWDVAEPKIAAILARPWTPEECECTCESGELYKLAMEKKAMSVERILIITKPNEDISDIEFCIMQEGYKSVSHFDVAMTPGRSKFLVEEGHGDAAFWASASCAALVVEREDAIAHWGFVKRSLSSRAYASDSLEHARRDLAFFDQCVNDHRDRHGDGSYLPQTVSAEERTNDPDKWGMSPLQVLCRAWERVSAETYPTAQEAIGGPESARDAKAGSPITRAWGILCQVFDPDFLRVGYTSEKHEAAYTGYQSLSFFGEYPNKELELEALRRAIALARSMEVNETTDRKLYWDRSANGPWEEWVIRRRKDGKDRA